MRVTRTTSRQIWTSPAAMHSPRMMIMNCIRWMIPRKMMSMRTIVTILSQSHPQIISTPSLRMKTIGHPHLRTQRHRAASRPIPPSIFLSKSFNRWSDPSKRTGRQLSSSSINHFTLTGRLRRRLTSRAPTVCPGRSNISGTIYALRPSHPLRCLPIPAVCSTPSSSRSINGRDRIITTDTSSLVNRAPSPIPCGSLDQARSTGF